MKNRLLPRLLSFLFFVGVLALPWQAFAGTTTAHGLEVGRVFLAVAILLVAAGFSRIIERGGQPPVLGELLMGVVLGNLTLVGIHAFDFIKEDVFIKFLAELGVGILLFQIGLESTVGKMRRVGGRALAVAVVGVVLPFFLGAYVVGPWFLPNLTFGAYLFIGAALTATSVGITARVFQDLGALNSREAQIILGAAVIDDVLGLLILAVVSALVTGGGVSLGGIALISAKAFLFLGGSIMLGQYCAPLLSRWFAGIHNGHGMKLMVALVFFLVFAYGAALVGLAPIVGAFAAGLVLESVHFRGFRDPELVENLQGKVEGLLSDKRGAITSALEHAREKHVEDLIAPLGYVFTPIFFVVTGMSVNLTALADGSLFMLTAALILAALAGKIACGLVAGRGVNRWVVGIGMVPRGEVGLIFANIGLGLAVISPSIFSALVTVVMFTTLLTPPLLTLLLRGVSWPHQARSKTFHGPLVSKK